MIAAVILVGVALTPALNAGEVLALVRGLVRAQEDTYTPLYVKAIKDVCLGIAALLGAAAVVVRGRTSVLVYPFLVFVLFLLASAAYVYRIEPQFAVAGLRWAFPIAVAFLLIGHVDEEFVARLADVVAGVLVVHLVAQLFELFFMSDWFGRNVFGLAGRVPGIFFIPNTAGFFAIVALFLAHFHGRRPWVRGLVHAVVPISVFLTQSGTGLIVYLLFVGIIVVRRIGLRRAAPLMVAVPAAAVALFPLLPAITGRGSDYLTLSGGTRIDILRSIVLESDLFPKLFGHATNTAVGLSVNLSRGPERGLSVITDSTYASIAGNLGLLGLAAFVLGAMLWTIYLYARPRWELVTFTMIFGLYGATTVVTEAFPMNLVFAVMFALYAERGFVPFLVDMVTLTPSMAPSGHRARS